MAILSVVCLVLILGFISLTNIPLDLLPDFEFPVAAVITSYSEAAPEEVENHVTRPLEESLGTVEGVENISSISRSGSSIVMLEFTWGTPLDFAMLEVRESIDMVRGVLPDDAGEPRSFKFDPALMPIINTALSGDLEDWELRRLAEDVIEPRLERVPGVANVEVVGGRRQEVRVETDSERLAHYGLNPDQVIGALRRENYTVSVGTIADAGTERHLRVIGDFESLEQMESLVLSAGEGGMVLLEDVATVNMLLRDPDTISTFNGETSVGIDLYKQADANTVRVSQSVWSAIAELEDVLPAGVQVDKVMD